ncbi:MAG: hypothetical protein KKA32_13760 [Actinobacteria bacterium]|nr:hypothetical protein [Actinomycetota bacterium]
MESLGLSGGQQANLAGELIRFLDQADDHFGRTARAATDYDRGLENGKALAFQASAIRLGELMGLVTQGMSETVDQQVGVLRTRAEAVVGG